MFLALPKGRALPALRTKSFGLLTLLCIALAVHAGPILTAANYQMPDLRFELPENGNLRIENLRGGVIVESWSENFVSVAAITDSGQQSRSPAVIQRTDSLLSIRVARGPQHINLQMRIPARAHAAIITSDGSVEVQGLLGALLVQTISGEIRVDLPKNAGADVVADSKTGTVSSSFGSALVNQAARPQLQSRIGNGGKSLRLYSQAGNITLANAGEQSTRIISTPSRTLSERRESLGPAELPGPKRRPELTGQEKKTAGAGTPAAVSAGPEEISEGDVIRVDTDLVSVNVSVVDRGTNRGVNDLTKGDFRLY